MKDNQYVLHLTPTLQLNVVIFFIFLFFKDAVLIQYQRQYPNCDKKIYLRLFLWKRENVSRIAYDYDEAT